MVGRAIGRRAGSSSGRGRTLEAHGPALGRPFVDTIAQSRHANMKELRPLASSIRVFFAFDPRRTAILLIGGDKAGRWQTFYDDYVPQADALYDEHLATIAHEGSDDG